MDIQELLGRASKHLSVSRAFGTAYEKSGALVITVAIVAGGGGGGEGASGPPTSTSLDDGGLGGEDHATNAESSSGAGGGFGGMVMPVGVYVVKDDRVRWVPAINGNLVIVVALMALRLIVRPRRRSRRRSG